MTPRRAICTPPSTRRLRPAPGALAFALALALAACGGDDPTSPSPRDLGPGDASTRDLGPSDQGPGDLGAPDLQPDSSPDPCHGRPPQRFCPDTDGDGSGDPTRALEQCTDPEPGWVSLCDDCDDGDATRHPGASERCDGVDQDCDGETDEGLALGTPCALGRGICRAEGHLVCSPAGQVACDAQPGTPEPETCDGRDEDCNGVVDDRAEPCECPPDATTPCGTQVGECQLGEQHCVDGYWGPCEGGVAPSPELCDGLDQDCNGVVDDRPEGPCQCLRGAQRPCGSDQGTCSPGLEDCSPDGAWSGDCVGAQGPRAELCDGEDDDCDGWTDEDYPVGDPCEVGQGACLSQGLFTCTPEGDLTCDATPAPPSPEVCNQRDDDCDGQTDEDLGCAPPCPDDMAAVADAFCMDRWEASRPDATADSPGADNTRALSRPGVMPWYNMPWATAQAACAAADKRLCTPDEWSQACHGPDHTTYAYGDEYSATTCNGIDAFCPGDPYPHCRDDFIADTRFHRVPTGSFPDCLSPWGIADLNGNVWEYDSSPEGHGRGGAYNCGDSPALHRCDYVAAWGTGPISNFGFRCCRALAQP